ncbi:sigma-70 family RNA polymerase sigma factor [Microbacterium enclense]|uniref:RNA polymerase sigma factor n=1 Tax=Microbacterium enclense TaxID=993073 RepID=UPI00267912A3
MSRTLRSVEDDDAGLWARVREGDELALAGLFDRYEGRLFRHASRLLTHREDAKDAVTVAFFELWRKRASVRLVDGSPLPWLVNTVAHCARNLERSARRYRTLLDRAPVAEPVSHDHDDSGVMAALKRLPEREQSVMVLAVLEGFSEREVAQTLGIPAGTVKSRLSRAKAKLRDELAWEGAAS